MEQRCFGNPPHPACYAHYHDTDWGVPVYDDRHLFEMLILEGAQAGLSWLTILKRREGYRNHFHHFDPKKVAAMEDQELQLLASSPAIIRNRAKIASARQNAAIFLKIQETHGSFSSYLWKFCGGAPLVGHWNSLKEIPCRTPLSDALSSDLKQKGMSFVGSKIVYAYLQAVGVVNDHLTSCFRYATSCS